MKVSKSLLQAILVGASISAAASSCSIFEDDIEIHDPVCEDESCDGECEGDDKGHVEWNCPACGMG